MKQETLKEYLKYQILHQQHIMQTLSLLLQAEKLNNPKFISQIEGTIIRLNNAKKFQFDSTIDALVKTQTFFAKENQNALLLLSKINLQENQVLKEAVFETYFDNVSLQENQLQKIHKLEKGKEDGQTRQNY